MVKCHAKCNICKNYKARWGDNPPKCKIDGHILEEDDPLYADCNKFEEIEPIPSSIEEDFIKMAERFLDVIEHKRFLNWFDFMGENEKKYKVQLFKDVKDRLDYLLLGEKHEPSIEELIERSKLHPPLGDSYLEKEVRHFKILIDNTTLTSIEKMHEPYKSQFIDVLKKIYDRLSQSFVILTAEKVNKE
jgi:hypothetical protein